ncbi:hypothetical protein N8766_03440 [bacterium]|nr:hypothetical protein [Verrucomicrobiota bacterium]MDA7633140.1 hypothetical protein [bacterium]MDA7667607.1 hypothetical protein [bacterium]
MIELKISGHSGDLDRGFEHDDQFNDLPRRASSKLPIEVGRINRSPELAASWARVRGGNRCQ